MMCDDGSPALHSVMFVFVPTCQTISSISPPEIPTLQDGKRIFKHQVISKPVIYKVEHLQTISNAKS